MDTKKKNILIAVGIYLVSAIVSFLIFSNLGAGGPGGISGPVPQQPKVGSDQRITFDENAPKTEVCPLNGVKYSKAQKNWWEKHRPLGIMIENHEESRPQSGISYADVVYEAVAEGGITRFLSVFYCQDAGIVGPVRSARTYFLDFISEYGDYPLYAHVGGANTPGPADALGQIGDYGWNTYNDLNQFSIGFPTYWRDYERAGRKVATEHTMYSTTDKLWKVGESRKLTNKDKDGNQWDENFIPYKFKNPLPASERPKSQAISFNFWPGYDAYSVKWTYDPSTNLYKRSNGGKEHTDKNTGKTLTTANIVFVFMRESRANDGYEGNLHMLYGTKGTGKAMVFMDGQKIDGTWNKKSRTDRMIIKDSKGQEVKFDPGRIWFEVVATATPITVN